MNSILALGLDNTFFIYIYKIHLDLYLQMFSLFQNKGHGYWVFYMKPYNADILKYVYYFFYKGQNYFPHHFPEGFEHPVHRPHQMPRLRVYSLCNLHRLLYHMVPMKNSQHKGSAVESLFDCWDSVD